MSRLASIALLVLVGCSKPRDERLSRSQDAAAVVVVERPQFTRDLPAIEETEPNQDAKQAQKMPFPGQIGGTLAIGDVDVFRLDITAEGALKLSLECNEEVDLVLEVLDVEGRSLVRSDRGPAKTTEGVANLPVVAGAVYLLKVSDYVKKGSPARTVAANYRLVAELAGPPPGDQEKEPNNEETAATPLPVGARGFGYLGWAKDIDVWRIDGLPSDGASVLDLVIEGVEQVPLKVELKSGAELSLTRNGNAGQTLWITGLAILPNQPYYVILESKRSDPNVPYVLRADVRAATATEEREPNDDPLRALPLASTPGETAGARRGSFGFGDRDVYRLDVTEDAGLDLELVPGSRSDAVLEVRAGEQVMKQDAGKSGAVERVHLDLTAGTTVTVIASGSVRGDDRSYDLRFTLTPVHADF